MWRFLLFLYLVPSSVLALVPRKVQGVEQGGSSSRVTVYFVTDRKATADKPPLSPYGTERSKDLTYGTAHVSVPPNHTPGVMEEPSRWKLQFSPDVGKNVVLLDATAMRSTEFFDIVKQQTGLGGTHPALIIIHGFWTRFDEAVRRAAQVKYDIGFDGPVIAYTWPSYGEAILYVADENNAEWTVRHLRDFLTDFSREVPGSTEVIAHSMGNRILAHALESVAACPMNPRVHLDQVILAAPDIDRETFGDIAESITPLAKRITVYASRHDQALAISHDLHHGSRAGEAGPDIVVMDKVDTIDVGDVDQSFRGHSYVFENATVLSDIASVLHGNLIGARCGFVARQVRSLQYWVMEMIGIHAGQPCTGTPFATSTPAGSSPPVSRTASRSPSSPRSASGN